MLYNCFIVLDEVENEDVKRKEEVLRSYIMERRVQMKMTIKLIEAMTELLVVATTGEAPVVKSGNWQGMTLNPVKLKLLIMSV